MIDCRACGAEISENAKSCVQCGEPEPCDNRWRKKKLHDLAFGFSVFPGLPVHLIATVLEFIRTGLLAQSQIFGSIALWAVNFGGMFLLMGVGILPCFYSLSAWWNYEKVIGPRKPDDDGVPYGEIATSAWGWTCFFLCISLNSPAPGPTWVDWVIWVGVFVGGIVSVRFLRNLE